MLPTRTDGTHRVVLSAVERPPYAGVMPGPEDEWYDEDPDDHDDDTEPTWFPGQHLPEHARAMGLTHHVPEGALLDFAGSLDGAKTLHRVTAWTARLVRAARVPCREVAALGWCG